jgi:hypothetical protein
MIVAESEKKSAEKRSHDNLDNPEVDAAAKRGAAAQLQHTAVSPAPAQEIFPVPPVTGVKQRTEPSVIVGVLSTQRSLFEELQSIDMTSTTIPHPPQQLLQLQGAAGLSGPVASGADAQADKPSEPSGPIPLAAINGAGGRVTAPNIFSSNRLHPQPQGWGGSSLSTPSVWSSASINLGNLGGGDIENGTTPVQEPAMPAMPGGKAMLAREQLIF